MNMYYCDINDDPFDWPGGRPRKSIPAGCKAISDSEIKPKTWHNSYSNPASQGALIAQCGDMHYYDPKIEEYHSAYSDRLQDWDGDRYKMLCEKVIGRYEQGWASVDWTDKLLKAAAKAAFALSSEPRAVRVVHWYNVATGYSCPTIECVAPKQEEA